MEPDTKYTGYANGKAYPLLAVKSHNRGLCAVEGMSILVWCTFEKIVANPEPLQP